MIPGQQEAFLSTIAQLFPHTDFSGVVVRVITPPGSPAISLVYIADLISGADLERLVLTPLGNGGISGPPEALLRSGRFPATHLRSAAAVGELTAGLLEGLAAVHVDGYPGTLLVGSARSLAPSRAWRAASPPCPGSCAG